MIIGLAGYARSGKDTAANILHKIAYVKLSFATPMKRALEALDPWISMDELVHVPLSQALRVYDWDELKHHSPDIRPLLQRFGTEVGRNMWGEDFWVSQAMSQAAEFPRVVFADVRFENEAEAVRNSGGKLLRITRQGVGPANDHISEVGLDRYNFDAVVSNNGTEKELEDRICDLVLQLERD